MKKQIAVMMAAATAVTTVAPVLAHADVNNYANMSKEATVKAAKEALEQFYAEGANGLEVGNKKVSGYLNAKCAVFVTGLDADNPAQKTVLDESGFKKIEDTPYSVLSNKLEESKHGWYVVTDANKLDTLLEKALKINADVDPDNMQVAIVDKGADKDSASYTTDKQFLIEGPASKAVENASVSLDTLYDEIKDKPFVDTIELPEKNADGNISKITVKLKSGEELDFEANDLVPNFDQGFGKDGKELYNFKSPSEVLNNDDTVYEEVYSFGTLENTSTVLPAPQTLDISNGDINYYKLSNVKETNFDLGVIYTKDNGYVNAEFINAIIDAKKGENFNFRDINYGVIDNLQKAIDDAKITKLPNGMYELKFSFMTKDNNDTEVMRKLQFTIQAKTQPDLQNVLNDLKGNAHVVAGKFTKLAGSNRYETAIEVSKEQFDDKDADSVVIVGGEAMFDGLAAAPLASAKNAPILLSHPKTGLDSATLNEIDRVCGDLDKKTVYIVGGVNSVPNKAIQQLKEKFGTVVVRESGQDRKQTSEQVAKRLIQDGAVEAGGDVFLVGYDGAADAMSISGVAANKKDRKISPILVIDKNRMGKDAREIVARGINDQGLAAKRAFIIGGVNSVGTQAYLDAQLALKGNENSVNKEMVFRIAGDNRYDTNLAVVNTFYSKDGGVKNVKYNDIEALENAFADAKRDYEGKGGETTFKDAKVKADKNIIKAYEKAKEYTKENSNVSNTLDKANIYYESLKGKLTSEKPEVKEYYSAYYTVEFSNVEKGVTEDKSTYLNNKLKALMTVLNEDSNYTEDSDKDLVKKDLPEVIKLLAAYNYAKSHSNLYNTAKADYDTYENYIVAKKNLEVAQIKNKKLESYSIDTIKTEGALFASGLDQYLVDAQTSGSFSAANCAPIVLTDKKLTTEQRGLLSKGGVLYNVRTGIYQVGGVVSADVMKEVVKLLDL